MTRHSHCTMQQYNSTTMQQYNNARVQQYNSTTVEQFNSATVPQYNCNCATVQQCNNATVQQWNSETMQQCNSNIATVQQFNSATVHQCNSATVHQCNSATVQPCYSTIVQQWVTLLFKSLSCVLWVLSIFYLSWGSLEPSPLKSFTRPDCLVLHSLVTSHGLHMWMIWPTMPLLSFGPSRGLRVWVALKTSFQFLTRIRSTLEFGAPVFSCALTKEQSSRLESVQKKAFAIILGKEYQTYEIALQTLKQDRLDTRRTELAYRFALKCSKSTKHSAMFPRNPIYRENLRNSKPFLEFQCHSSRYFNSPIPALGRLLNKRLNQAK